MAKKQLPGIRPRNGGFTVYVRVRPGKGGLRRQQFPTGTPTSTMMAWQETQRRAAPTASPAGSFAADVAEYLTRVTALVTYKKKAAILARWVHELGGDRARDSITPTEIDQVIQRWCVTPTLIAPGIGGRPSDPRGLQGGTVRQRVNALGAFFSTMNGKHAANPVRGCTKPQPPKPEARGLDYAVIARILAAMPPSVCASNGRPLRPSLAPLRAAVLAYTGMAPATLKRLTRASLVVDDGILVAVRLGARLKGGGVEARTLTLTGPGRDALTAFDAANAYGYFATHSLNVIVQTAAASVGVPRGTFRLYDLRHSFGTELYRTTRDLSTVARFLQHARVSSVTERYALAANAEVDRAAAAAFLAKSYPNKLPEKRKSRSVKQLRQTG